MEIKLKTQNWVLLFLVLSLFACSEERNGDEQKSDIVKSNTESAREMAAVLCDCFSKVGSVDEMEDCKDQVQKSFDHVDIDGLNDKEKKALKKQVDECASLHINRVQESVGASEQQNNAMLAEALTVELCDCYGKANSREDLQNCFDEIMKNYEGFEKDKLDPSDQKLLSSKIDSCIQQAILRVGIE